MCTLDAPNIVALQGDTRISKVRQTVSLPEASISMSGRSQIDRAHRQVPPTGSPQHDP